MKVFNDLWSHDRHIGQGLKACVEDSTSGDSNSEEYAVSRSGDFISGITEPTLHDGTLY